MRMLPYDLTFDASMRNDRRARTFILAITIAVLTATTVIAWRDSTAYVAERDTEMGLLSVQGERDVAVPRTASGGSPSSSDIAILSAALSFDWRTRLRTIDSAAAITGVKLLTVHIAPENRLEEMTAMTDTPAASQDLLTRLNDGDQRWFIKEQTRGEAPSSYVIDLATR